MEIILDFSKINNKDEMFELIRYKLNSEEFYGNNLDALYDVLSYEKENVKFLIYNIKNLDQSFKLYVERFIVVLEDIKEMKANIQITVL